MADLYFKCNCGKILVIDQLAAGQQIDCPNCKSRLNVPAGDVTWPCACGVDLSATDDLRGEEVQCTACGKTLAVPKKLFTKLREPEQRPSDRLLKKCPACGTSNLRSAGICSNCGYSFKLGRVESDRVGSRLLKRLIAWTLVILLAAAGLCIWKMPPETRQRIFNSLAKHTREQIHDVSMALKTPTNAVQNYWSKLKAGDFSGAQSAKQEIDAAFDDEQLKQKFWRTAIPSNAWRSLLICRPCDLCADGKCQVCQGAGLTAVCDNNATNCPKCVGRGFIEKQCTNCVCPVCKGKKRCVACQGAANLHYACRSCNGTGVINQETEIACPECQVRGVVNVLCKKCSGTGKVKSSSAVKCNSCDGTGWRLCGNCGGSGKCPVCNNSGHDTNCPVCHGAPLIRIECEKCKGSGKSIVWAKCKACGGSANCSRCAGTVCVAEYNLPVNSAWLLYDSGCLFDNHVGLRKENNLIAVSEAGPDCQYTGFIGVVPLEAGDKRLRAQTSFDSVVCVSSDGNYAWVGKALFR